MSILTIREYLNDVSKHHDGYLNILFSNSENNISRSICSITNGPVSHVSISLDRNNETSVSFNLIDNGLARETVKPVKTISIPISGKQLGSILKYIATVTVVGNSYSAVGAVLSLTGIATSEKTSDGTYRMFCSQFVDSILKQLGMNVTKRSSSCVTPSDLMESLGGL